MPRLAPVGLAVALLTIAPALARAAHPCSADPNGTRRIVSSALVGTFARDAAMPGSQNVDRLWKELIARGTPLVERDVRDEQAAVCATVTFLYRDAAADSVRLVGGVSAWLDSLSRLDRVPG